MQGKISENFEFLFLFTWSMQFDADHTALYVFKLTFSLVNWHWHASHHFQSLSSSCWSFVEVLSLTVLTSAACEHKM